MFIIHASLGALADTGNLFGRGSSRIVARSFRCSGTETRLNSCSFNTISLSSGTSYQTHTAAGVICQGNTSALIECNHGDVRLVNGLKQTEGRVEVCSNGNWAIVCDADSYWPYSWDISKTQLVCKRFSMEC